MKEFRERRTIQYEESVQEEGGYAVIGKKVMSCEIEVVLDVEAAALRMGQRACRSKGGFCVDGPLTVKRVGVPKVLAYNPLI